MDLTGIAQQIERRTERMKGASPADLARLAFEGQVLVARLKDWRQRLVDQESRLAQDLRLARALRSGSGDAAESSLLFDLRA